MLGNQSLSAYGPRQAAYDLKKLRGKQIVRRIASTRRYEPLPSGLRAITALLVLRNKAIKPLLAAAQEIAPNNGGQNPRAIDRYYLDLQRAMQGVFHELGDRSLMIDNFFSGFALKRLNTKKRQTLKDGALP